MKRLTVALVLLQALPCVAQQGATAELIGRVASAGSSLAGVTVTIMSPSLQGKRLTVTGENGGYRFAALPPGDYVARFDLEGFAPAQQSIRLALTELTRADVELVQSTLEETLTVESDSARVAADASIATIRRGAELRQLPVSRDIRSAVLLSPSTSAEGTNNRLVIEGAPSWESLFLVDGVVVNEYLTGQPHDLYIEDAIEEIAVLTGAVSAEYGRFTGGVVSTITKSGGNDFRGSIRDMVTNDAWTHRTPSPDETAPFHKINHAVEGTLGGFLLKDRLWFFAAARDARTIGRGFTDLTNITYRAGSREKRFEGKLTQQIASGHSIVASWVDSSAEDTNVNADGALDLGSLIVQKEQPARLLALTYDGVVALNSLLEIHDSRKNYALRGNGGLSADRVGGTVILVRPFFVMNAPRGCGICGDDERDSDSWIVKTSLYRNTRRGNHTVVAGAERFHEERINAASRSSSEFYAQIGAIRIAGSSVYPVFDGTTLMGRTTPLSSEGSDQNSFGAFLNDRWDITSALTFNLGVRYDRNNVQDALHRLVSNDHAISPRLSATFDLRNDGRHRLSAGYGRYVAKVLEGGGAPQQLGVFSDSGWRYRGPEINGSATPDDQLLSPQQALAALFSWFDSAGGAQIRPIAFYSDPRYTIVFHGSLKSPSVDEWTAGYALQLRRGFLRADLVSRDWHNFYAQRMDTTTGKSIAPVGIPIDVAWVVNDDSGTVRKYRGVQLQGSWRFGRMSVGGGYTWSTLRGNDDEEDGVTFSAPRNTPLQLWYPEFLGYAQRRPIGYLRQDQRHRARLYAGREQTFTHGSLTAFLLQSFQSGTPYSAVADIDPTGRTVPYSGIPADPGYAFTQVTTGSYFFSKRGAFRTDGVSSTDLALNWEIPVGGVRAFIKGDVLNLFNNAAVVSPNTTVSTRLRGGPASGLVAFNPFTEVPVEGVNYRKSPQFGQPTGPASYQAPRAYRVTFGARF